MGIHEKTLKRLIECKNRPGYQTLFKIYRVIYKTKTDTQLLDIVPQIISEALLKGTPKNFEIGVTYNIDVEKELQNDTIFCEIYFHAATGGVTKEFISYQYGRHGEDYLSKMLKQNVLALCGKNTYVLGDNQANLTPETIKIAGLRLVEKFHKPEDSDIIGENYQSLYATNINEDTYNKWLEIDDNSFLEKIALAKVEENKGNIKAFTFSTTDTLKYPKKETRH